MPRYHEFLKYWCFVQKIIPPQAALRFLFIKRACVKPGMYKNEILAFDYMWKAGEPGKQLSVSVLKARAHFIRRIQVRVQAKLLAHIT